MGEAEKYGLDVIRFWQELECPLCKSRSVCCYQRILEENRFDCMCNACKHKHIFDLSQVGVTKEG